MLQSAYQGLFARRLNLAPALLAVLVFVGTSAAADEGAVFRMDGETVSAADVRAEFSELPAGVIQRARTDDFAARSLALDWYYTQLFARAAADAGLLEKVPGLRRASQFRAAQVLAGAWFRTQQDSRFAPSEPEMRQLYQVEPALCASSERIRLARIGVSVGRRATPEERAAAKGRFEAIQQRLADGEAFGVVANEASDFSAEGAGGDMGWISVDSVRRTANGEELARLPVGARSEVLEIAQGWLVYEVLAREDAGQLGFDQCRPKLAEAIHERYNRDLRRRSVDELARRYESDLDLDAFIAAIRSVPRADDPRAAAVR